MSSSKPAAPAEKKGEVNELRTVLRAVNAERNSDASTARKKCVSFSAMPDSGLARFSDLPAWRSV